MKWEAHQASGFFGLTAGDGKSPAAPRRFAVVDIDAALESASDVLDVFATTCEWPDAAPFSGGVFTDWPKKYAQGLAVCRAEVAAIRSLILKESVKNG